jgi:hypothetical protein
VNIRPVAAATLLLAPALILAGCAGKGELIEGGVTSVRTGCPTVGVPAATGDITLFDPAGSTDANAIDVTAAITDVRSTCTETGEDIVTNVTFQVNARRTRTEATRDVQLPYFLTVVQGGSAVVAKRIARVNLHFDAGQARASASGAATSAVNRSAATLPENVRERLTRRRKAGEEDAAVDPLAVPEVKAAVQRATFEALVGFQLTADQLKYNATR